MTETTTETITLPATRHRIPAGPLWSVEALDQHETHDGVAFVARIHKDGVYFGNLENEGRGGETLLWPNGEIGGWMALRQEWEAFDKAAEALQSIEDMDGFEYRPSGEDVLIREYELHLELRTQPRGTEVMVPPGDDPIAGPELRTYRNTDGSPIPREWLRAKRPGWLRWDGTGWSAP